MSHHHKLERVLALRMKNVVKKLGEGSTVCLLNLKDILKPLKDKPVIVMACNIRIKHAIPGIMRAAEELDAVLGFEIARSEGGLTGGYTGFTPEIFFNTVVDYAKATKFTKPFFIHADHITVKGDTPEILGSARDLIDAQLKAGFTSFAIDASFNHIPENIKITTELSKPIREAGIALEVEVGEIKSLLSESTITTVEEAATYIAGLKKNGVHPDLLAINNGSKHGNYLATEVVHIDLKRTGEIYEIIKKDGVVIAQHGITGTPLNIIGQFADYGIRKGNVGTEWQNIAHKFLPAALMKEMQDWAKTENKDIKMATKPFKDKIDNIPESNKNQIENQAYLTAKEFIIGFRAKGTASTVIYELGK